MRREDPIFERFSVWRERWTALADYQGPFVPDIESRIDRLLSLWSEPIPGQWQRGLDVQLLTSRYRRRDTGHPHTGEHTIEHEILVTYFEQVSCLGVKLVDGINAFPLCINVSRRGRNGNVEADLLLLGTDGSAQHLFLCEVKHQSNNAWYATVECLRQYKLFLSNPEAKRIFVHRQSTKRMPPEIASTALIVAPEAFYSASGKKLNAIQPARSLIARMNHGFGIDVRLAIWDRARMAIREL